jgi:hypothetical protein
MVCAVQGRGVVEASESPLTLFSIPSSSSPDVAELTLLDVARDLLSKSDIEGREDGEGVCLERPLESRSGPVLSVLEEGELMFVL